MTFECRKCHVPISETAWKYYGKKCKPCREKDAIYNKMDKHISIPSILYPLCILYGHIFLYDYLHGIFHPGSSNPSLIISYAVEAIICYVGGLIACIFFVWAVIRQKREKPDVYKAQRWYSIILHVVVVVASAIMIPSMFNL